MNQTTLQKLQETKLYAGIDLHKQYAYVTIMDQLGYVHHQGKFENKEKKLVPFLQEKIPTAPVEAIIESTYGWYWLGEELESAKIPYVLAHPKKVHDLVKGRKTDKKDSQALADLYRTNLLPEAYIPTPEERDFRELLRFRFRLVQQKTGMQRRLRDILAKQNIECPYKDILGKRAKEWLRSQTFPFPYAQEVETSLALCEYLEKDIAKYTKKVTEQSGMNQAAKLLESIPGIGKLLALLLAVEIGTIKRFPNDRAFASYAGLVPSVSSSGGKTHLGETSQKSNPYIRWALTEAVSHVVKKDPTYKAFYDKLEGKRGKSKARVAIMHKLARAIFVMLTKKEKFRIQQLPMDTNDSGTQT